MLYSKTYGLQKETRNYLRRLYTFNRELASSDIADLDNFIKGTKQLGIWQNMVCWPLRSQHNLGSGSTVLSLGGFSGGVFNGTLINGPTWANDGITTNGTNNYVDISTSFAIQPSSAFSSLLLGRDNDITRITKRTFQYLGGLTYGTGWTGGTNNTGSVLSISSDPQNTNQTVASSTTTAGTQNIAYCYGFNFSQGFQGFFSNGSNYSTTAVTFAGTIGSIHPTRGMRIWLGQVWGLFPAQTYISFFHFNTFLSTTQHSQMYNLIKTTIGKGLGLP